ncbi:MAG: hypothetical protein WDM80_05370 [Limisphaerales bacterium]
MISSPCSCKIDHESEPSRAWGTTVADGDTLGNTGDATALPALERTTHDPEPLIAEHARWAMEQIQFRGRLQSPLSVSGGESDQG